MFKLWHMIVFIFLLAGILLVGCDDSKQIDKPKPPTSALSSEKRLIELLGDTISINTNGIGSIIEYCPDNTCESFNTPIESAFHQLSDFVYIYLFYVSDYYVLDDFKHKKGGKYISEIIKRNAAGCPEKEEQALVKCVLETLGNNYSIKVKFVRYDENKRNEVVIDLDAQLNRLEHDYN